jgi:hypothetical protein
VSADYSSSLESRVRRLADQIDHGQLLKHAEQLQKGRATGGRVFWHALEIAKADATLERSLRLTIILGDLVYQLRPNGPWTRDDRRVRRFWKRWMR